MVGSLGSFMMAVIICSMGVIPAGGVQDRCSYVYKIQPFSKIPLVLIFGIDLLLPTGETGSICGLTDPFLTDLLLI